jgi:hypothetical protein
MVYQLSIQRKVDLGRIPFHDPGVELEKDSKEPVPARRD